MWQSSLGLPVPILSLRLCYLEGPMSQKPGNFVLCENREAKRLQKGVACQLLVAVVRWQGLCLQDLGPSTGRTDTKMEDGITARKANISHVSKLTTEGSLLSVDRHSISHGYPCDGPPPLRFSAASWGWVSRWGWTSQRSPETGSKNWQPEERHCRMAVEALGMCAKKQLQKREAEGGLCPGHQATPTLQSSYLPRDAPLS